MKQATAELLHALNRRFYTQHAETFSATRAAPWPGLARALELVRPAGTAVSPCRVLDVGCGNGRALSTLRPRCAAALQYLGVDASEPLLEIARARWAAGSEVRFAFADFCATAPAHALPDQRFELVLLLGVLHGVAAEANRRALLAAAVERLASEGALIATIWRYDRDRRFGERRVPPERYATVAPGIAREDLDARDELLRFGSAPDAVRYAHFPDEPEIERLLAGVPAIVAGRFLADGASQQLNEYLLLRRR